MPPCKHALLGASKAYQWINCPPSVRWEQQFPEPESTEAAEEGTLAHAVAEEHLRMLLAGWKTITSEKLKKHPLYKPSMEEYVGQYTDYVMALYNDALTRTPDAKLLLEEHVDFSEYVPEGFGTADCVLVAEGQMHVMDLKYGKGVPVDAKDNPQLRLYALGALAAFDLLYDITDVIVHIIQPRLDSYTSQQMPVETLKAWGDAVVRPAAKLADEGAGEFKAGEHCRWCRCKHVCRAYADERLKIARLRFTEPDHVERDAHQLSNGEIAEILLNVDELTRWAKSLKDWALEQAVNNNASFPGFKLVEGRSNRIITDEGKALEALDAAGFTPDTVTTLKGLGALEEIVGKTRLADLLGELLIKPAGKPVLALEGDKRPALNSFAEAQKVFTTIDEKI